MGVEVVHSVKDSLHVSRPHVLTGIHPEPGHAHVDQLVHVVGRLGPHVLLLQSQI